MPTHTPTRPRRLFRALATAFTALATASFAQTANPQSDPTTLHVYTNILQIPVLVLGSNQQPVPPIAAAKFTVQLDSAPPFRPRRVRIEGEDPITLSILIDGTHRNGLTPILADALAGLAPGQLRPDDHFAMYVTDGCALRRIGEQLPVQTALIHRRVELALEHKPYDPRDVASEPCRSPATLWKSMAMVAFDMAGLPGRRILLAVTDGVDTGKDFGPAQARQAMVDSGVAAFSLAQTGHVPPGPAPAVSNMMSMAGGSGRGGRGMSGNAPVSVANGPSDLATVSEGSGGLLLQTSPRDLKATLDRFVGLVRGRYIVEFTRPTNLGPGGHILNVSTGQPQYFIRTAGTSMPMQDPTEADPTIEHGVSDPASIDQTRIDNTPVVPAPPPADPSPSTPVK